MKTSFQVEINTITLPIFFPQFRVKDKLQILEILLESTRYILHSQRSQKVYSSNKIIFHKERMSRIFFAKDNKMYSLIFPFNTVINADGIISFNYKNYIDIDSYTISNLIKLLKNPLISSDNCWDFIEPITGYDDNQPTKYWPVFRDLLIQEDGYIRYDKDEPGYLEAKGKNQQARHPLYHLDIFYSGNATFKLGLSTVLNDAGFIDTLNPDTDCRFLK